MSESKSLISGISKKWKLEQIPTKKLEIENKLMEERLNQLKNELAQDKSKKSARSGGTIWSGAQAGPLGNYGKSVLKSNEKNNNEESITVKLNNRQLKLKVLKDEVLANLKENEKSNSSAKDIKRLKCGQCEKNSAFCRCLECGEDYCANCFTNFHTKGALQKHRTMPIKQDSSLSKSQSLSDTNRDGYSLGNFNNFNNNNRINSGESTSSYSSNLSQANNNGIITSHPNDSLINGSYDEREAHESFQKAVLEWRNSNNKNNNNNNYNTTKAVRINMTPKQTPLISSRTDANVGSDQNDLIYKTIKGLVDNNHSLSYAERMLLRKHRRQELEFSFATNDPEKNSRLSINFQNDEKLNKSHLEHINFNDIMAAVNENDSKKSYNHDETKLKLDFSVKIEELETKDSNVEPKKFNERLLTPDIMEPINHSKIIKYTNSRSNSIVKSNKENFEDEIPKSTRLLNSARVKSARKEKQTISNSQIDLLNKMDFNLTRIASPRLKALADRKIDNNLNENNLNGIGQFILLDVEDKEIKYDKDRQKSSRPSSSQANINKLSYKFYEMSPQSWRPSSSLSSYYNIENPNDKKTKNQLDKSIKEISKETVVNNSPVPPKKSTKTPVPNKIVSQSVDFKSKIKTNSKNDVNKTSVNKIELKRHKTFISPTFYSLKNPLSKSNRPVSATGSFIFGNKQNIEIGNTFSSFDMDDGRSSRVCQNEDDDDYYGKLQTEFDSTIHRVADTNLIREIMQSDSNNHKNMDLKDLTERLSKNLDLSIRNEELADENDQMDFLDLEELKNLN